MYSTVFTKDIHLHNLFAHAEKILDPKSHALPSDSETCKILNAAHDIQLVAAIKFLPTILNQLFVLLTCNISDEVGHCIVRLIIHIVNLIHEAGRHEIILAYIKVHTKIYKLYLICQVHFFLLNIIFFSSYLSRQ